VAIVCDGINDECLFLDRMIHQAVYSICSTATCVYEAKLCVRRGWLGATCCVQQLWRT